jgi:collagenase-like PrtC family protease
MQNGLTDHPPRKPIELLAPAGTPEAGYAALHYGADAVYLGLENFSARAAARNFSLPELADITGYAHSLEKPRRIYAAVNTLVLQKEFGAVIDLLAAVAASGVDAVIVQDLGVVFLIRKYFPQLKIHASTQMAIHNKSGVETAAAMGVKRVTLARELTLTEISKIAALKNIETEVFIHGALCYSYSGLCLFSSHLYGRSGNRGRCAYPCREWFEPAMEETAGPEAPALPKTIGLAGRARASRSAVPGFIFSMKDLALGKYVAQLQHSGVTALKIEGRMKSPLYVAAVVNYYRKLLDGSLGPGEENKLAGDIKKIFSRPWTELYIKHRKNRDVIDSKIVGHRGFPAGKVEKILKSGNGHSLRFKTGVAIELHDGLQIDIKGWPRPFGFAVKNMYVHDVNHSIIETACATLRSNEAPSLRSTSPQAVLKRDEGCLSVVAPRRSRIPSPIAARRIDKFCKSNRHVHEKRRVFAAPAGATVEIPLPRDHPIIPLDAVIYSASSQEVKREYKFFQPKAWQYRARQKVDFEIKLDAGGFEVSARTDVLMHDQTCRRWHHPTPSRSHGESGPPSNGGELKTSIARDKSNLIPSREGQGWDIKKHFEVKLQPARDPVQVGAAIEAAFRKLGNTSLQPGNIKINNPAGLFVQVSALNAARRDVTAALEGKILEAQRRYAEKIKIALKAAFPGGSYVKPACQGGGEKRGNFKWSIKTDQPHIFDAFADNDWENIDEVVLECSTGNLPPVVEALGHLAAKVGRSRLRLSLPVIMREWEISPLTKAVTDLITKDWCKWQISNLGGLLFLHSIYMKFPAVPPPVFAKPSMAGKGRSANKVAAGPEALALPSAFESSRGRAAASLPRRLDISADWPLYAMNKAAVEELVMLGVQAFTLSPEDDLENMRALLQVYGPRATVIIYQDTPLMISENYVTQTDNCSYPEKCKFPEISFQSSRGDNIRVINRQCRFFVINNKPYSLAGHFQKLAVAGATSLRVDFMYRRYSSAEALDVWHRLRAGFRLPDSHAANFQRGLE